MTRSRVDLPAPDARASARQSPDATSSATSTSNSASRVVTSTESKDADCRACRELHREQERERDAHEHRRQRKRAVEVGREAVVDRERDGLRDAAKRAGEHQCRAELAESAAPGERAACN